MKYQEIINQLKKIDERIKFLEEEKKGIEETLSLLQSIKDGIEGSLGHFIEQNSIHG
jgi:predicted phage-related endonuclease